MPNRNVEGDYRYAFQGQEKDPETGKEAFELRLWDARIGRWLTTDPYGQYASPYLGMGNNPVSMIDPDGGMACPEPCTLDGGVLPATEISTSGGGGGATRAGHSHIDLQDRFSGTLAGWNALTNNQFSSNRALADLQWNVSYGDQFRAVADQWRIDASGFAENFNAGWNNWDKNGIGNFWMNAATYSIGGTIGFVGGSSIVGTYATFPSLTASTSSSVESLTYNVMWRHGKPLLDIRNAAGQFARGNSQPIVSIAQNFTQRYGLNSLGQATRATPAIPPNWSAFAKGAVAVGGSAAATYWGYKKLFQRF